MAKSNLCENLQQKRFDYVAGALTGGFRQKNLNTKDISKKSGIPERRCGRESQSSAVLSFHQSKK